MKKIERVTAKKLDKYLADRAKDGWEVAQIVVTAWLRDGASVFPTEYLVVWHKDG